VKVKVYLYCRNCRTPQKVNRRKCVKCGKPFPKINKTFYVRVTYRGKTVNRVFDGTKELAEKEGLRILADLQEGSDPKQSIKSCKLLKDFLIEDYLPWAEKNLAQSTFQVEKAYCQNWIIPILGELPLSKISPLAIEKLKKALQEQEKAPRTVQHILAILKKALNRAKEWGFLPPGWENPVTRVKAPRFDNTRVRFFSPEELEAFFSYLKERNHQAYVMAVVAAFTGLRFSELASLSWRDIDFARKMIYVRETKNRKARYVPMIKEVEEALKSLPRKSLDDLVFPNSRGEKYGQVPSIFKRAIRELGFNEGVIDRRHRLSFHSLRHTAGTLMAAAGVPLRIVQGILGHETPDLSFKRYSHLAEDMRRQAGDKLAQFVEQWKNGSKAAES